MKKNIVILAICLSTISLFFACKSGQQHLKFAKNTVVAHRGAWKTNNLPENSIAALQQAIQLGCTGSEFDVWRTADDSLVINHDAHFNDLLIEKSTYTQLSKHQLENGETIPTLRQYLLAGMQNNTKTRLVCEIKPSEISKEYGQETAKRAVALIHQLHDDKHTVYISFDFEILKTIIAEDPKASTQYLEGNKSPLACKEAGIAGVDFHYSVYKKHPEWITEAKEHDMILNAWTVNDKAVMQWLLDEEFDFITTNEPELLFTLQ